MKHLYVALGWVCVALGVIGLFLPIMPTAPFLILAAFLFSKGSPRMHRWLLSRPHFGPVIRNWEEHGMIRTRAKVGATLAIAIGFGNLVWFVDAKSWVKPSVGLTLACTLAYIWTRPSKEERKRDQ